VAEAAAVEGGDEGEDGIALPSKISSSSSVHSRDVTLSTGFKYISLFLYTSIRTLLPGK